MNTMLSGAFIEYIKDCYEEMFGGGLSESVSEAMLPDEVNYLGMLVNPSVYTGIFVIAIMLIFALIVRIFFIPKFKDQPGKLQMILEMFVGYFDKSSRESIHGHATFVGPYTFTAATFIALSTLAELLGLRPAMADINMCLAMGLTTFIVINICGFKQKGFVGRMKRFANPINIITDISVPLSLSLRLFGSIMSGFIIMELIHSMVFTVFVIPAAISVITTFFHAAIQSYLFATLTNVFVGEAIE